MLIGVLPWVVPIVSVAARNGSTLSDLYIGDPLKFPAILHHGLVVYSSVLIGLWTTFFSGAEFIARHKRVFMLGSVSRNLISRVGLLFLLYPLGYLTAIGVLHFMTLTPI